MTDPGKILEQALEKAKKNGFNGDFYFKDGLLYSPDGDGGFYNRDWESLMFDRGFAKALWGDACDCGNPHPENNPLGCYPEYLSRMQDLAICHNRIIYIQNFV